MARRFIALAFMAQAPKTFEEFELAKIKAYHGLRNYHEELDVDLKMGEQGFTLHRTSFLDGPRQHCTMTLSNPGKMNGMAGPGCHHVREQVTSSLIRPSPSNPGEKAIWIPSSYFVMLLLINLHEAGAHLVFFSQICCGHPLKVVLNSILKGNAIP